MTEERDAQQAAPWEAQVEEMAQRLARQSRRSGIVGFLGGMAVMAGLIAVFFAVARANKENTKLTVAVQQKTAEVKQKTVQAETAEKQASAVKNVLIGTVTNDNTAQALNNAIEEHPDQANLIPARVYLHVSPTGSMEHASELARTLRAAGYIVPGIDKQDITYAQTEIHYYTADKQSETDVNAIARVLADAGEKVRLRQVPPEKGRRLLPRAYGLWVTGVHTNEVKPGN